MWKFIRCFKKLDAVWCFTTWKSKAARRNAMKIFIGKRGI